MNEKRGMGTCNGVGSIRKKNVSLAQKKRGREHARAWVSKVKMQAQHMKRTGAEERARAWVLK